MFCGANKTYLLTVAEMFHIYYRS